MAHIYTTTRPAPQQLERIRAAVTAEQRRTNPALRRLPHDDFAVAAYENGRLIGGAIAENDCGWVFIDSLWVDSAVRNRGIGSKLLIALETVAAQQGYAGAWLFSASFQAPDFYRLHGYQAVATQLDRPPGHSVTFFLRSQLRVEAIPEGVRIHQPIPASLERGLAVGLTEHAARMAPLRFQQFGAFLADETRIVGGFVGNRYWNWFDLRYVWVATDWQGQGWDNRLMTTLIDHIKTTDDLGIITDSIHPEALPFYQRHGFRVIGTIDDRPPGQRSYLLECRF